MAAPFLLGEWDVENVPQGLKPSALSQPWKRCATQKLREHKILGIRSGMKKKQNNKSFKYNFSHNSNVVL